MYELQTLQDQLEHADREQRQAGLREQALLEALQSRQQRIADLEVALHEIESVGAAQQSVQREIVLRLEGRNETAHEEIERLREEVDELHQQLAVARGLIQAAEDRCVLLEGQLEEAEKGADAGRESRHEEDLRIAHQEVAEANSKVEALQTELNRLKGRTSTPRRPSSEEAKNLLSLSPDRLCATLLHSATQNTDVELGQLALIVGQGYQIPELARLIRELKAKYDDRITRSICAHFGASRDAQDTFDLISELGWDFCTADEMSLWDSILTWFTWAASLPEIRQMLVLIDGISVPGAIRELFEAAAARRAPEEMIALLDEADASRQKVIVQSVITMREVDQIPALLTMLQSGGRAHLAEEIISEIAAERPGAVPQLLALFEQLGADDEASLLLSRVGAQKKRLRLRFH
ncbi:hypothetical protein ABT264_12515 [Streptomyces virginiae]|uniref:hypothetical protein n=1 Tax=Streptomyces virginiae TaxID=1961 RepID=UPI00331AB963